MRLLGPLLVLAGLLCFFTGILQMALNQGEGCTERFECQDFASVENALAGITFFLIATVLWGIAGTLRWMRKKFEDSPL